MPHKTSIIIFLILLFILVCITIARGIYRRIIIKRTTQKYKDMRKSKLVKMVIKDLEKIKKL
jgi:hypothetical protein